MIMGDCFQLIDPQGNTICLLVTEDKVSVDRIKDMMVDLSPAEVKVLDEDEYQALLKK